MPTIQYHATVRDKQQTDHHYVVSWGGTLTLVHGWLCWAVMVLRGETVFAMVDRRR